MLLYLSVLFKNESKPILKRKGGGSKETFRRTMISRNKIMLCFRITYGSDHTLFFLLDQDFILHSADLKTKQSESRKKSRT